MDIGELIAGLDEFSLFVGTVAGLLIGAGLLQLTRYNMKKGFQSALDAQKESFDNALSELKASFSSLSSEALAKNQQDFLSLADRELGKKTEQHANELESKKELIDQSLESMSKSMTETLNTVPANLDKNENRVTEVLDKSTKDLKESNQTYLNQLTEKAETQTKEHVAELDAKKELIDQQLEQMSSVLKTVPTELEKNQKAVSDVIDKSAKSLEESNKVHLNQLQDKSDSQTKEHFTKLDEKDTQINRRLGEMDDKLGKVQKLIDEFEKARESKLGALDDQLKSLTATTSSLQRALADNQARGQWGERIAEQILEYLGLREGISYKQQLATPSGERPDFTFLLPNQLSLNMDCKFPIDNYLKYVDAENDNQRVEYSKHFLRNVEKHVTDVTNRDYINPQTVDCVLIFIPNEQIYRFINEQGSSVIDTALRNKVILCSPMTLYIVLAVIRQASQNFNVEQKSREIVALVNEIRSEWKKYSDQMSKLERSFKSVNDNFHRLNFTRSRALDRRFDRIEVMLESDELDSGDSMNQPLLSDEAG